MGPNGGKFRLNPAKLNLQVEWLTQPIDNSLLQVISETSFSLFPVNQQGNQRYQTSSRGRNVAAPPGE